MGLLETFEDLSFEQKKFLVERGGSFTIFLLGKIPAIYRAVEAQTNSIILALFKNGTYIPYYVDDLREKNAINYIKEAARNTGKQEVEVILVYGGAHDFKNRIKSLNDDEIIFEGSIETSTLEDQANSLQYEMKIVVNMLNENLGKDFAQKYGDKWSIRVDSKNLSAKLVLCLYLKENELYLEDKIKKDINACRFKINVEKLCDYHFKVEDLNNLRKIETFQIYSQASLVSQSMSQYTNQINSEKSIDISTSNQQSNFIVNTSVLN